VIAAANPVYGMYDRFKKPHENIGLPDSLLSRFDLLFIVLDKIDTKIDRNISDHVLKMHLTPYNPADDIDPMGDGIHDEDDEDEEVDTTVWSKQRVNRKQKIFTNEFSRKYIEFAKKQYKPVLTDEACEEIANKYGELREEERNQTLPITARCLESIIRLSTAHAKLRLRKKVELEDVDAAMEILSFALTNDADPQSKNKHRGQDNDDEDGDQEMGGDHEDDAHRRKKRKGRSKHRDSDDDAMDEDDDTDAKMGELDDDGNANRRRKKRKQPDQSTEETEDSKRRRSGKKKGGDVDEHRVKGVTVTLATYFRVNRIGQVKKEVLLRKINEDGAGMNQDELNGILKHLHDKNKIFFLDPVVHQL